MQLSVKQKKVSRFFAAYLNSILYFEPFFKKDDPHSFFISAIKNSKIVVR